MSNSLSPEAQKIHQQAPKWITDLFEEVEITPEDRKLIERLEREACE